jgi:hypothetical protein
VNAKDRDRVRMIMRTLLNAIELEHADGMYSPTREAVDAVWPVLEALRESRRGQG